ncbi:RHS repeat protein [Delftia sp. DLF01]|uniref:RHS repeat-associated core domain-containing protein n=1 Tax=Delftia sp. DLF01 TaxID=2769279 RepID=UPI00177ADC19|nr:RHS repeat-associated core domain-containing protein [Delftia sp. DLF01]MBD9582761.1 RHS repeat protein [Delftia sp. DLF01]
MPWLDSAEEACDVGFSARAEIWQSPWSVIKSTPYIKYDPQGFANECKITRLRDGQGDWGNQDFGLNHRRTVCPANSSSASGGCNCDSGYREDIILGVCQPIDVITDEYAACSRSNFGETAQDGFRIGQPILPATREKYRSEVDWRDGGAAPLSMVRTYRSSWGQDAPRMNSGLGRVWSHGHSIYLKTKISPSESKLTVYFPEGGVRTFSKSGASQDWIADDGIDELTQEIDGWVYRKSNSNLILFFSLDGILRKRVEQGSFVLNYFYDEKYRLDKVENNFGRSLRFSYNESDQLILALLPDGRKINYVYDGSGRLIGVNYPDGQSRGFLYEKAGFPQALTGIVDEAGVRWGTFDYDDQGRAISTELSGSVERYQVSYPSTNTASVRDPLGTTRNYVYSVVAGRLAVTSGSLPSGFGGADAALRVQDSNGLITSEKDFKGITTATTWDAARRLPTSIIRASGSPEAQARTIHWHESLNLPVMIKEAGRVSSYTYDSQGRVLSESVSDSDISPDVNRTRKWTYTPQGLPASIQDANGGVTSYSYDSRGNMVTATNAQGHVTDYSYDDANRMVTLSRPNGLVTSYAYDPHDQIISESVNDGLGNALVTQWGYKPYRSLESIRLPSGKKLEYSHDAAHRVIGWSSNQGSAGLYVLDAAGNRIAETIKDGATNVAYQVQRSINAVNRVGSETVGEVQSVGLTYDANGDLATARNGLGQTTTLDVDGLRRLTKITDPLNASASLSYNALDAVTAAQDFKGVTTTYTRDALGNAKAEATPDAGNITATYDALGLIATAKDAAGRTLAVQRDALGRPTQLQYGSTATSTLRYDLPGTTYNGPGAPKASTGHLSEIQDPGVTTQYQRDILGRVLRKSQILANGDTKSLIHSYVPAGQGGGGELQSITYPSGKQATYLYDSTGQITGLQWNGQPLVTGLAWSPLGQPTAWQWAGFVQQPGATATLAEQRSYNTAGQLASSQLLNLTWDAAGRISLIQQRHMLPGTAAAQQAKLSSAFSYDAVGRLTASAHSAPAGLTLPTGWSLADTIELSASGYAWDANGNRTQVHYSNALASGTSTLQRSYQTAAGTNRLQSYAQTLQRPGSAAQNSNVTFSYDAAGALVKKGDNHLHYGADGRIAKAGEYADAADARAVSYVYNALGQRVLKSDARGAGQPATLQTLYAEDGIGSTVLGQYANQRSANSAAPAGQSDSTEIIYLPTASGPMPIAAEINGRLYAIHTDHLNTPRRLTNQQGQVAWQWLISGFGEVRPTTGDRGYGQTVSGPSYAQAVKFDLRYPGQVFDEETGLSYNLHRYYDAATGRYMQADPIGLEGGWNRFGYVGGDPLSFVDPEGLQFLDLTTFAGARRNTTLDDAVRAGAWTRAVTLPAVTTGLTPSAIGLVGSTSAPLFCPATTTVTSWAPAGIVPDLAAGRWVMQGGPTSWNYIRTGVWGPRFTPGQGLSWPSYPLTNSVTGTATVSWPTGLANFWRGIFGQRQIVP